MSTLVSGTTVMLGATALLVGTVFLTSIFFQTVMGYSALRAGVAFLPLALAITAGTHVASKLLASTSPRNIATGGLTLVTVGAVLLSLVGSHAHFAADLLPGMLILGSGVGMVFVAVAVTAMAAMAFIAAAVVAVLVGVVAYLRMPEARMTGAAAMHMH